MTPHRHPSSRPASHVASTAHLAVVDLLRLERHRDLLDACLSEDERARAGRWRAAPEAERFRLRRGALRVVLAARVGAEPAALRFARGPAGKPRLEGAGGLEFSASSSGHLMALAVARDVELGLDLERVREVAGWRTIAERFLGPEALARIEEAGSDRRSVVFLRLWTAKEAVDKLLGRGLTERPSSPKAAPSAPIEEFEVGREAVLCLASRSRLAGVEPEPLPPPVADAEVSWTPAGPRPVGAP